MAAIRGKDTAPEIAVRRFLHAQGFRYSLHNKKLAGKPDIVLTKYNTVVFVNGCYWHRHKDCRYASLPKSNVSFWKKKFSENVQRDADNHKMLESDGWRVLIVWECEVKNRSFEVWLPDAISA